MTQSMYDDHIKCLIKAYQALENSQRADLRHIQNYTDVIFQVPALYAVKVHYHKEFKEKRFGDNVIAALLLYWRDRSADASKLENASGTKLGQLFVGDGKERIPVKLNRLKRIMQAENLKEGFHALRTVLQLFRSTKINWTEVAFLISAWRQNEQGEPDQLNRCRKNIAEAYFTTYQFTSKS